MIDEDTTALLTIRAWSEQGAKNPLRAQVRSTTDVSSGFLFTVTVTDIDDAVLAVRAFLEEVVRLAARDDVTSHACHANVTIPRR
jgi:hypothetical protein